jgi:hypothetical protein
VACIVFAHRAPEQLALLLSSLRDDAVKQYVHIDARANLTSFAPALGDAVLLTRRETRWGGIELVDAALDGLARAYADGCDYFFLLSGQDLPARPLDEILQFVEEAPDRTYLSYWQLPHASWRYEGRDRTDFYTYTVMGRRETCIPRGEDTSSLNWKGRALNEALRVRSMLKPPRRYPDYVQPFGGDQWWNLSRGAAEYVLNFVKEHPDYRRYHEHTSCPDELFFQSILLGTAFADSAEVVNDSLRYMQWAEGASHPRILTADDLPAARASGALFARKFDDPPTGA